TGFTWNVTSGSGSVLTFGPVADTFVDATNPTRNYGGRVVIRVNDDPIKHGLLKFTVSGVGSATVSSATLRLFVTDRSPDGGSVYQVADDTWQERTVTWNDAPAAGSLVGSIGPVAVGTWVEVDLTSYVTGDGTYSIRIQSASTNGAAYSSKEATSGNGPQLVVTLAP
ncbi:MAG: DNRLRE domain-containing protein, partial [Candidatus Velamenicoccus archaeovorus]